MTKYIAIIKADVPGEILTEYKISIEDSGFLLLKSQVKKKIAEIEKEEGGKILSIEYKTE